MSWRLEWATDDVHTYVHTCVCVRACVHAHAGGGGLQNGDLELGTG